MKKALYTLIALLTLSIATQAQNVGVNTDGSDPDGDALLHVNRTTGVAIDSALIRIENEDNTTAKHVTGLEFINSATGPTSTWRFYNPGLGSTDFRINNNGNDYMTILNSGNVGIGTTTPSSLTEISSGTNGDAVLTISADTDNNDENDNPGIHLTQDGGAVTAYIGLEGNTPGTQGTSTTDNALMVGTEQDHDVQILTNDIVRMTIDHTGNVGIGTTAPTGKLHVHGDGVADGGVITRFTSNNNRPFDILSPVAGDLESPFQFFTNNSYEFLVTQGGVLSTLNIEADADVRIESINNANMLFVDYSADAVGIGTNTPSSNHLLSMFSSKATVGEVVGVKMSNANAVDLEIGVTGAAYTGVGQPNAGLINVVDLQPLIFGTNNTERMRILQTGNVGIGTAVPLAKLHVQGTDTDGEELIRIGSGRPWSFIQRGTGAATQLALMSQVAGDKTFKIQSADATDVAVFTTDNDNTRNRVLLVPDGGNVGIGTTNPLSQLHVTRPRPATISTTNAVSMIGGADVFLYTYSLDRGAGVFGVNRHPIVMQSMRTSDSQTFPIILNPNGGDVGIGTLDPTEALHVVGNIRATTGFVTPSDRRYKKDIKEIDNALGLISQLNGYNYNYKTEDFPDEQFDSTAQVGFIAQELQEVLPQVVSEGSTGYLAVDYAKVTPVLLMAIKEQQAIIEAQNAEIESLKTEASNSSAATNQRLEDLEAKINALLNAQAVTVQK